MKSTNYYSKFLGLLLLCFVPLWVMAQTITVTGTVKDAIGDPVIGASILETGTSNGTITDIDGNFSLTVSSQGKITVSFIGYKTQEINVQGRSRIDVTLQDDTEVLDEVVVVGYGTAKKSDVTGSIATVNEKTLKQVPVSNVAQSMQGRISGVQVQQTSTRPG